jgi:hypothetical protein
MSVWRLFAVIGPPRSEQNTYAPGPTVRLGGRSRLPIATSDLNERSQQIALDLRIVERRCGRSPSPPGNDPGRHPLAAAPKRRSFAIDYPFAS